METRKSFLKNQTKSKKRKEKIGQLLDLATPKNSLSIYGSTWSFMFIAGLFITARTGINNKCSLTEK